MTYLFIYLNVKSTYRIFKVLMGAVFFLFCMQHIALGRIICYGAVPPMLCPLNVRARNCNLARVLATARLFFAKDTMGSLTSTSKC